MIEDWLVFIFQEDWLQKCFIKCSDCPKEEKWRMRSTVFTSDPITENSDVFVQSLVKCRTEDFCIDNVRLSVSCPQASTCWLVIDQWSKVLFPSDVYAGPGSGRVERGRKPWKHDLCSARTNRCVEGFPLGQQAAHTHGWEEETDWRGGVGGV